jgi:hypothetical protein
MKKILLLLTLSALSLPLIATKQDERSRTHKGTPGATKNNSKPQGSTPQKTSTPATKSGK